jgi:hypothetical protein
MSSQSNRVFLGDSGSGASSMPQSRRGVDENPDDSSPKRIRPTSGTAFGDIEPGRAGSASAEPRMAFQLAASVA